MTLQGADALLLLRNKGSTATAAADLQRQEEEEEEDMAHCKAQVSNNDGYMTGWYDFAPAWAVVYFSLRFSLC